jgi:dienelactone hydrolase
MGWSFGGIVTTLAASGTDRFAAAVIQAPGALNWDRSPELRAALPAAARKIRIPTHCAVAENDQTTESARAVCDAIKSNGILAELKIYPPFSTPQPRPNVAQGHALFGPFGVAEWTKDVFDFLERTMRAGKR